MARRRTLHRLNERGREACSSARSLAGNEPACGQATRAGKPFSQDGFGGWGLAPRRGRRPGTVGRSRRATGTTKRANRRLTLMRPS